MRNWMLELMMDTVINKYGFEARETIKFCTLCELYEKGRVTTKELTEIYAKLIFR